MPLLIRKAAPADAPALARIHAQSWLASYSGVMPDDFITQKNVSRPQMWERILSGEHGNYIAELDGAAVGFAGLQRNQDGDLQHAGEVAAIYLHPDYFGMGYGKTIMDFAVKTLREQDFDIITLWVLEANPRARRFYEKCGFVRDGTLKQADYGKQLTVLRYILNAAI